MKKLIGKEIALVTTADWASESWNLDENCKFVFDSVQAFLEAYEASADEIAEIYIWNKDKSDIKLIYKNKNIKPIVW